jgi:hypothetical protein
VTSTLLGLALGLLTSLFAWWLVVRAVAPKLRLSPIISKRPDLAQPGRWRYRIKIVNQRRWPLPHTPAVEVRIVASLRLKGFAGYKDWTNFPIPISHIGEMDMIERNAVPRLRIFDMQPRDLERLVDEETPDRDSRDVELEHLLALGAESEVRVVVSAAHPYTGARRSVTGRFTSADIACGAFSNRAGTAGLRLAPSSSESQSESLDPAQTEEAGIREPSTITTQGRLVRLFQYGSNMSERHLATAVRRYAQFAPVDTPLDVRLVGSARLAGWSLVFDLFSASRQSLVADIVEADAADEVWEHSTS